MVAYISANHWRNFIFIPQILVQRYKLRSLARLYHGYRGLQTRWNKGTLYLMTLWKCEDDLHAFLSDEATVDAFKRRKQHFSTYTLTLPAYNFIPWQEVIALIRRNGKPLQI